MRAAEGNRLCRIVTFLAALAPLMAAYSARAQGPPSNPQAPPARTGPLAPAGPAGAVVPPVLAGSGAAAACAPRLRVDAMTESLAILAAGGHAGPPWQHRAVPGPGVYRKSACRGPAPVRPLLFRR